MKSRHPKLVMTVLEERAVPDANDTLREAIDLGTVVRVATASGSVDSPTDVNMYRVYLGAGRVSVDIDTPTNGVPGLGSYIRLFDDGGAELAGNNDAQAPDEPPIPPNRRGDREYFDSYLESDIPRAGWYFVGVSNWQNTSYDPETGGGDRVGTAHLVGEYDLHVRSEAVNNVLQLTGTRATSSETRGDFDGDRFAPTGTDTRSQDRRASAGPLTAAEERRHAAGFRAFLRGETAGNALTGGPSEAERASVIEPIVSLFLAGGGAGSGRLRVLAHEVGSPLSNLVGGSGNFRYLDTKFRTHIRQSLEAQVERGVIDFAALNLSSFLANPLHRIRYAPHDRLVPFTLRAVLGGTQGIRTTVEIQAVTPALLPTGGGSVDYRAVVRYEIFDVFGAGDTDRYIAALESMWQLQHRGARATPFINKVTIETTVAGSIAVPERYNSVVVR